MSDSEPTEPAEPTEALAAARKRRVSLKTAVSAVEVAAASPAADPSWRSDLVDELRGLRGAFDDHVDEVEGDDGLLAELLADAPQLANHIRNVRDEHPDLCVQIDSTIEQVEGGAEPEQARDLVLETLLSVARHRQHGADLVYQAYYIDIGGG
ncbi:MAG: hypothetical protein OEU32_15100 [Acidimicrobiia bacterium]|nr:hypothetical protein [Acidimicrobiia bacterium]